MAELIEVGDSLNDGREKLNVAILQSEEALTKSTIASDTVEDIAGTVLASVDEAVAEAVRVTNEVIVISSEALEQSENTQTQLNTIVINGDSSVEAAQARVEQDGTVNTTLKARLDKKETETAAQLAETTLQLEVNSNAIAINSNLIQTSLSGRPNGAYTTLALLQAAHPTDDGNIYVVGTTTGYIYDWIDGAWTNTNVQYGGTVLPDSAVSSFNVDSYNSKSEAFLNKCEGNLHLNSLTWWAALNGTRVLDALGIKITTDANGIGYVYNSVKGSVFNCAVGDKIVYITKFKTGDYTGNLKITNALYTTSVTQVVDCNINVQPNTEYYAISEYISNLAFNDIAGGAAVKFTSDGTIVDVILEQQFISFIAKSSYFFNFKFDDVNNQAHIISCRDKALLKTLNSYDSKKLGGSTKEDIIAEAVAEATGMTTKDVSCNGDSLTQGTGSPYPYPYVLGTLLVDRIVNRFGVGGDGSLSVAYRQGGMPLYVQPCTIPADTSVVSIVLKNANGDTVNLSALNGLMFGVNPCFVNGIEGTLSYSSGVKFTRTVAGSAVTNTRPTLFITETMKNHKDDIHVIWAGTNDGITVNGVTDTFNNIDAMIESINHRQYIVIGMTAKTYMSNVADINVLFRKKYGNRFLDIRQYLLNYGLADAGITPTTQDTTDIANGEIPISLRSDAVHLNTAGYDIVAKQVYEFGKDLGYWS